MEELSEKGKAAQRVAPAGSHHCFQAKGTKEEIEWCVHATPGDPPPPRASSLVDFPHFVSQLAGCNSNFSTEDILLSFGCSSGASCLEKPAVSSTQLVCECKRLGLCIAPEFPERESGLLPKPGTRADRAED